MSSSGASGGELSTWTGSGERSQASEPAVPPAGMLARLDQETAELPPLLPDQPRHGHHRDKRPPSPAAAVLDQPSDRGDGRDVEDRVVGPDDRPREPLALGQPGQARP